MSEKPKPAPRQRPKKELVDESIQGTNSSSIVSKRSVERLYWSRRAGRDHVEFFRHFVAKPIRRSPVINRGYWTRMEAMKHVIEKVMSAKTPGKKVVVNLGCGFDPYAFQYLSAHGERDDVFFLDVDYPDLMRKKADVVRKTPSLLSIVGDELPDSGKGPILMHTQTYAAVACDLRELDRFQALLASLFDLETATILFTAEVSITYMTKESADALIRWAATLPRAEFALLEQLMPAGPDHPFSRTMMAHFNNLRTPLHSVSTYPTTAHQRERFASRGWKSVAVQDLYEFWKTCVSDEDKTFVESVEDFDEWEEFILFCQHYFILHASNWEEVGGGKEPNPETNGYLRSQSPEILPADVRGKTTRRKYGAGAAFGEHSVVLHGGADTTRHAEAVAISTEPNVEPFEADRDVPTPRVCHELVKLADGSTMLLVGGRTSPSKALADCWLYENKKWHRVQDLPRPRTRHCMFAVGEAVYVFGGCVEQEQSPWLKWDREAGWTYVHPRGTAVDNLMSACVSWNNKLGHGFLAGGMRGEDICRQIYKLSVSDGELSIAEVEHGDPLLSRYGARCVLANSGDLYIAGGVGPDRVFANDETVVKLDTLTGRVTTGILGGQIEQLPLLCGFNMDTTADGKIIIYGGGAVCFSFGSYWNGVYVSGGGVAEVTATKRPEKPVPSLPTQSASSQTPGDIQRVSDCTRADFEKICRNGVPVLFTKTNLGPCTTKWTADYLKTQVGATTSVVVHDSQESALSFANKNFKYTTMPFGEFVERVFGNQSHLYFRALSATKPKDAPARFADDFPTLANDFHLPAFAQHLEASHFSSPLRISSPDTSMWLHYDVTANVLCQIVGTKRVRMYPPQDVVHLSFAPGSSSSSVPNVFESNPGAGSIHPIEFTMEPGDVVFIPPLWLHATNPLTPSVSLNFFWKDLGDSAYAHGKDVYGNRDLGAYENGRKLVDRITSGFTDLPTDVRQFYMLRLAEELRQAAL